MKSHLQKSIIFFIVLILGFSAWNWNLGAKIKLKTESQIKTIYVPMLCYHRVTPEVRSLYDLSPEMFESQLQFFKDEGYHPITGLQYIKLQKYPEYIPDKPVILTFDDGSIGHYQYVFPLLKKYGFQATFFVYPNVIFSNTEKLITWSELAEMAQAGMDIESHTMSHSYLTKPGANPAGLEYLQWLDQELRGSKTLIEQKINRKVTLLGYPYGWYNRVVEAEAARAGYEGAFTVNWGVNRLDENPFRLKRRVVSNNLRPEDFKRYLSSQPLSLKNITPTDGALFTEKPVIRFQLTNREVDLLDITVRDEKGVTRSDAEGTFTFDNYELRRPGYYQITISGFDDQNTFYQSSWGFDYRPSPASSTTALTPMPTPAATSRPSSTLAPTSTATTASAKGATPTRRRSAPTRRKNTPTTVLTPTPTSRQSLTPTKGGTPTQRKSTLSPTFRPDSTLAPTPRRSLSPTPTRRMNTPSQTTRITPTSRQTPTTRSTATRRVTPTSRPTPTPSAPMTVTPTRQSLTPTKGVTPTRRNLTLDPTSRRSQSPTPTRRINNPTPSPTMRLTSRSGSTLAPTPTR